MAASLDVARGTMTLDWNSELDAIASRLAERAGQSKEEWLRRLLLNAMEDAEDSAEAEAVLARINAGEERTYRSDEVRRELGLDD